MPDIPPAPPFGSLRLASQADLPRIAVVAAAGFEYSQVFKFTRPYHNQYPEDTIKDYQNIFRKQILDPQWIVLVKEDIFDPSEGEEIATEIGLGEILPRSMGSASHSMEKVIVGVCSWKLEEGSPRRGDFQPPPLQLSIFGLLGSIFAERIADEFGQNEEGLEWESRDTNPERLRRVNNAIEDIEKEYFQHASMLDMIVIHPKYWRRGHGSALASWGLRLARVDNVDHGVVASTMGEKLFASLGFEHIKNTHVEGEGDAPEGIDLAVFAIWKK